MVRSQERGRDFSCAQAIEAVTCAPQIDKRKSAGKCIELVYKACMPSIFLPCRPSPIRQIQWLILARTFLGAKATARHGGIFPVVQFALSTRSTIRCAEIYMDASTIEWISFPSFRAILLTVSSASKSLGGNVASCFNWSVLRGGDALWNMYPTLVPSEPCTKSVDALSNRNHSLIIIRTSPWPSPKDV